NHNSRTTVVHSAVLAEPGRTLRAEVRRIKALAYGPAKTGACHVRLYSGPADRMRLLLAHRPAFAADTDRARQRRDAWPARRPHVLDYYHSVGRSYPDDRVDSGRNPPS